MKSLKNNLYMLKLMFEASPLRVILNFVKHIINSSLQLVYTVLFLRIIMQSIENGVSFSYIVVFLVIMLVYNVAINFFLSWFIQSYTLKTNIVIQEYLLEKMYKKAVECDLSCYENPEFYNKYTRASSDILQRGIRILENVSKITGDLISIIVCVLVIAAWEPIAMPIVAVCSLISILLDRKRSKLKYECMVETTPQQRQSEYVKRTVYLQDYAKEMRLSEIFFPLLKHFRESVEQALKTTSHYYGIEAWLRVAREIFMNFGNYLVVQGLIIYRYIEQQAYNLSDVVTILNAASALQRQIFDFSWVMAEFMENGLYVENLKIFLEYETKIKENEDGIIPKDKQHRLTLENVSFTYDGQKNPVLKNINIEIESGQKVAFVGHNGAGKSTLVKLLMRLYDVSDGKILLDGVDIKEYKLSEYRQRFGTVFQDFKIFATDIEENVLLHPVCSEDDKKIAKQAVVDSGLWDKIKSLEKGMNTQLTREFDDNGTIMSGGEFQKIAVARVFAKQSAIAILDEPSSALDPISEYEMFENMMKACKDKTVIFISHRLSSAVSADVIYMLENGEVIESGSHSELMKKDGKYAKMFNMQSEQYRKEGVSI